MFVHTYIGPKIQMIANALAQQFSHDLTSLDLTSTQAFMLRFLSSRHPDVMNPRDLERQFDLSHPTVSGLLSRLEAKGFLRCEPDPADRRFKRIVLTQKAWACEEELHKKLERNEEKMLAGFSAEQVRTLHQSLDLVLCNVVPESARGGFSHDQTTCRPHP